MLFTHRDAVASSAGGRWKYFERKNGKRHMAAKHNFCGECYSLSSFSWGISSVQHRRSEEHSQSLRVELWEAALILLLGMWSLCYKLE